MKEKAMSEEQKPVVIYKKDTKEEKPESNKQKLIKIKEGEPFIASKMPIYVAGITGKGTDIFPQEGRTI